MSRISILLENILNEHKISRWALANAAGASDSTITKIMNDNVIISVNLCIRIGIALSLPPIELLNARIEDEKDELNHKMTASKGEIEGIKRLLF